MHKNISENYGEPVAVTIEDYLMLNPTGQFEIHADGIREIFPDGGWELVGEFVETPLYAETYPGGRLTGKTSEEAKRFQRFAVYESEKEFYSDFIWEQHDACHSPERVDHHCPHCQMQGWV